MKRAEIDPQGRREGSPLRTRSSIAIDLVASSGRLVLGQIVDGRLRVHEVSRFSTSFSDDGTYLSWSIDRIDDEIRRGISAEATATRISSVAVDSWAVDYILLDARQQRVGGAICYRDKRTEGMIERVTAKIPGCEIYHRTGISFNPSIPFINWPRWRFRSRTGQREPNIC